MKQLPKVFMLLILLATLGICENISWIGTTPRSEAKGFSAYGLSCGTRYDLLAKKLPPGWESEFLRPGKSFALQDSNGRHLLVYIGTDTPGGTVETISIFPVTSSLSIELDGEQVVFHTDSLRTLEERLGTRAVELGQDRFFFKKGRQFLILTFGGKNRELSSVSLSLRAPAL